jgi:uroporphyrinogen III methyltransferase/synthase
MPITAGQSVGIVYLVGAGPGDPGLFTLRGARLLEQADVVVFDSLANPRLLDYCPQAQKIDVGKRAAAHTQTQDQINALLVDLGLKGKRVVRLKGGDPFVFGRGGEECEALAKAGVAFEVVPGITASIAVPAYAGIPITHRDLNSSFTLITGHEKEEEHRDPAAKQRDLAKGSSDIDWSAIAKLPCVAFYMGAKSLPRICQRLIEHGMPAEMPAATIQWGTTPKQRTVVGTVETIAARVTDAGVGAPAITIIGKVVELRPTLNWFEHRPLFGQTIVVTRTRHQASELSQKLESLGAQVIEAPTIELAPPADISQVDSALLSAGEYDWIIFTSANGVKFTRDRLFEIGKDIRVFGNAKIAAIGTATADAIRRELCLNVDLCPKQFVAEALADALIQTAQVTGKRFLLLRADIARPLLRDRLAEAGAVVQDIAIYESVPAKSLPMGLVESLQGGQVQWVTFTSSSTAKNFTALLGSDYRRILKEIGIASIGPITSQTLVGLGLKPTIQTDSFDLEGLIQAILKQRPSEGSNKAT